MLRATAACHFSPVCWTATSAPAALARLLFEHQEPRIIQKTQRFATSLTFFAHVPSFYWLYTRVDLLSADVTSLLCLTPLLCFSTLHVPSFYWRYVWVDLLCSDSTRVLIFLRTWHLYTAFQLCILSEVRLLNFLRLYFWISTASCLVHLQSPLKTG